VPGWLIGIALVVFVMTTGWALLVVAARRLPPGTLRDLATILPACVTTVRRLRRDPRVPRRAKVVVALAAVWVVSPIDLIPEFLPVIGPLDDVVVMALALRYAARQVPHEVLFEAWPAEPRLLARLIGRSDATPGSGASTYGSLPAGEDPSAARNLPAGEDPSATGIRPADDGDLPTSTDTASPEG
jgi:uncharacterized membrane protein YkvA (DUF1232 family)